MSQSELACVYAALILHDDGLEISVSLSSIVTADILSAVLLPVRLQSSCAMSDLQADNIQKLTSAANVKVEPYWPGLFAKLFANKNMDDLITNVGAGESSQLALCNSKLVLCTQCVCF